MKWNSQVTKRPGFESLPFDFYHSARGYLHLTVGLPSQILLVIQTDSWPHNVMSLSLTQQNLCNHQKASLWDVGKGKMLARVFFFSPHSLMGTRWRLLKSIIEKLMIMLHLSSIFGAIKSNEWTSKIRRTFNKEIPKRNSKTITSHRG